LLMSVNKFIFSFIHTPPLEKQQTSMSSKNMQKSEKADLSMSRRNPFTTPVRNKNHTHTHTNNH